MGDQINIEEILAEQDEVGFVEGIIGSASSIISSYGWYILAAVAASYYLWRNHRPNLGGGASGGAQNNPMTEQELSQFQANEEARLKRIAALQEKYDQEAIVRAEKIKQKEEEKRQARLAELEKLGIGTGNKLGTDTSDSGNTKNKSKSNSFRPEYNPLMGDTSSSSSCFRRPGGRSGG